MLLEEGKKDHEFVIFYDQGFSLGNRAYDFDFINYKCKKCGLVLRLYKNENDWQENIYNMKALDQGFYVGYGKPILWETSYELQELSCDEIIIKNIIE